MNNDFWPKITYNYADTDNVTYRLRNLQTKNDYPSLDAERLKQKLNHFYGNSLYGMFIKESKHKENKNK